MLGAIAGDYVGSKWEFSPTKEMDFELMSDECRITDDTVMTIAIADALLAKGNDVTADDFRVSMVKYGLENIDAGYGMHFLQWLLEGGSEPYGSAGNGSCMRVSPVAWFGRDLVDVARIAALSAAPSHNHRDGIRGAVAVAVATRMALEGWGADYVSHHINRLYGYTLDIPTENIRPHYRFMVLASNSAPPAIRCALEAWGDWEGSVRRAVSLGGDADTMAAIAGGIAEAAAVSDGRPGVPAHVAIRVRSSLPESLGTVFDAFMTHTEGYRPRKTNIGDVETMLPENDRDEDGFLK